MSLTPLLGWLFGRSAADREGSDDFIEFDRSGKARFDVAGYLASKEGGETLERIAEANQKSSRNLDEAA